MSSTAIYGVHCGTSYAAKLLGISVGSVFKLIRTGHLHASRTKGGHHRILLSSLEDYLHRLGFSNTKITINARQSFRVMIIEADRENRVLLTRDLVSLHMNPVVYESGVSALLDLALFRPQVLVINCENIIFDFPSLIDILKNRFGAKMRVVAIFNSINPVDMIKFKFSGVEMFLFPAGREGLKEYLVNLRLKVVAGCGYVEVGAQ